MGRCEVQGASRGAAIPCPGVGPLAGSVTAAVPMGHELHLVGWRQSHRSKGKGTFVPFVLES